MWKFGIKGMAVDLQQRIDQINSKAKLLVERCVAVEKLKLEAEEKVAALTREIERQQSEIESLKSQLRYLTLADVTNPTAEDRKQSRAIISGLVREIDRCIADLSD